MTLLSKRDPVVCQLLGFCSGPFNEREIAQLKKRAYLLNVIAYGSRTLKRLLELSSRIFEFSCCAKKNASLTKHLGDAFSIPKSFEKTLSLIKSSSCASHLLLTAIHDAGAKVRRSVLWIYGRGFDVVLHRLRGLVVFFIRATQININSGLTWVEPRQFIIGFHSSREIPGDSRRDRTEVYSVISG